MTSFPTSKIELHQWFNTILLGIVGFFVVQTYNTVITDHDVLAKHDTRISVVESEIKNTTSNIRVLEDNFSNLLTLKQK